MRIIIASVKKMVMDTDSFTVDGLTVFLERTDWLPVMNLRWRLTHAIISCKGIQCQCIISRGDGVHAVGLSLGTPVNPVQLLQPAAALRRCHSLPA